ncbi:glycerate kinase [Gilliamella sp. Choc5-1]|jgi:glycerate 2-kinase|uniref:glycerate kinase n=1 Tax=Gilliamella sp. Choc5-1 TaxID=3120238 RepID=UPI00080EAEDF|nr:glycerate kinase [Gilliamella apicola]OCG50579.1 glycerate kinase [Gilliamella apicola]
MKIIIAPDSFKESLSAIDVANMIKNGFSQVYPDANYALLPVADGGEGTVDAMVNVLNGHKVTVSITDPLGERGLAFYGISDDGQTAIIEMAAASGLERVSLGKRDAKITTSYGTGELIKDALDRGCKRFIIGIGGSATNDGGAGMLQALGVKLLDKFGNQIGYGGVSLSELYKIDITEIDRRIHECEFEVACDVTNPLTGENGASVIFGPQKGASPQDVKLLDANLKHFAKVIKQTFNIDIEYTPGTGAAGGMGAALLVFMNAKLRPGIEIITELLNLDELVQEADLVITGEGRLDHQSINGKVPVGIANIAKKHNKPVIAIVGSLGDKSQAVYPYGISAMFSILSKVSTLSEALDSDTARANLYNTAMNIALTLKIGNKLN